MQEEAAPAETDLVIQVNKHTSSDLVKITSEDGSTCYVNSSTLKSGKRIKVTVPKGTKTSLEFPVFPPVLKYSGIIICDDGLDS